MLEIVNQIDLNRSEPLICFCFRMQMGFYTRIKMRKNKKGGSVKKSSQHMAVISASDMQGHFIGF